MSDTKEKEADLHKKINDLEFELAKLKKKKYGLVWEEKPEVFDKESQNALPVLKEKGGKFKDIVSDPNEDFNILIEGDNYHSLSVLSYTHLGKVDVVYIDPPYNTGNKDFIYNDHFVDKDDKYRHSKWLSFIAKRLNLVRDLLSPKGVVFISIDDNELAQLKLLCDHIFGDNNVEIMIWHKVGDDSGRLKITHRFRREHEYVVVCYRHKEGTFFHKYLTDRNYKNEYTNPDNDHRGAYKQGIISNTEENSNSNNENYYSVKTPSGRVITRQWRFNRDEFNLLDEDRRIYYGKNGDSIPSLKVFIAEKKETTPTSILSELGTAKSSGIELEELMGSRVFSYPKPIQLIKHLLKISSSKDSLVLDFFAGSGTTGQAVLEVNQDDVGRRKYILCTNNENNLCENVTYERLKKSIGNILKDKNRDNQSCNLKYLKTDFIKTEKTNDNLRRRMVDRSTEILCLKENTFNLIKDNYEKNRTKIFQSNDKYTAILFDLFHFEDFVDQLRNLRDKPVSVYVFSHTNNFSKEEFGDLDIDFKVEPIPEKILETYKKIFNF